MTEQASTGLINYLLVQQGRSKNWFGFKEQKTIAVDTAHRMAVAHGDKMTPEQIVDYVTRLNNLIYLKLIKE